MEAVTRSQQSQRKPKGQSLSSRAVTDGCVRVRTTQTPVCLNFPRSNDPTNNDNNNKKKTTKKNWYKHSMQRDAQQGRKSNKIFPILQNLLFNFKQKVRRSVTIK